MRSIKGRAFASLIYALTLFWYTLGCRWKVTVDVAASDYGHTAVTLTTGEKVLQLLRAIFGMQANGNLAGVYWQAFILNSYLFIPLGYLVLLWLLCGSSSVLGSSVGRDVITDGDSSRVNDAAAATSQSEKRTLAKIAFRTEMICIATSFVIEVTQEITKLGMFDINDLLANSIGSCIGIGMVWLWQHLRGRESREVTLNFLKISYSDENHTRIF